MGLGGSQEGGRLATVQEELPGDVDGILDAVRRIILMGEVQSIIIREGEPLTYQRLVHPGETIKPSESTASFAELSPMDIVRQISMEEYDGTDGGGNVNSYLQRMFINLEFDGWAVTHLLVGEKTKFWAWQGISPQIAKKLPHFLGARIEREKTLPEDVFVLCGAKTRNATIAEIGFALKGNVG